ncbi:hypothetical protein FNF27_03642 [Cafeteria roenbergensis]|uniref:Uncharacterized protein n=1 Tax=Cafeteria roenbergensis TaxID=33653 RepID=A0A5A8EDY6_CAFRO|nr:hypothetical protein FNF27_03642 [Cafeteria roenbergensis]
MAEGQAAHVAADRLGRGPAHWLGQRLLAGAIREASSAVAAAFSASPASTRDSLASRWAGRASRAGLPAPSGGASAAAAAAPVKVCPAPAAAVGGRRQAGSRPKRGRLGGIGRRATGASGVQVTLKPAEA